MLKKYARDSFTRVYFLVVPVDFSSCLRQLQENHGPPSTSDLVCNTISFIGPFSRTIPREVSCARSQCGTLARTYECSYSLLRISNPTMVVPSGALQDPQQPSKENAALISLAPESTRPYIPANVGIIDRRVVTPCKYLISTLLLLFFLPSSFLPSQLVLLEELLPLVTIA